MIISLCLYIAQAYSEVPSTPLHTATVLREEEENWQDVKVNVYIHHEVKGSNHYFLVKSCTDATRCDQGL